jgi:hypothetical protein
MMKPKSQGPHDEGLLEYMEDIIGSHKHVEAIEEGAKKCVRCGCSVGVFVCAARFGAAR